MTRKLMKGIFFVFIFSLFTLIANAECVEPEHDTQTTLNRQLACSAAKQKTTKFSYPQGGGQVDVYSNSLCSIKCNEDLLLLIDTAKNVRAGMGFNYPLFESGQRTCTATYNYQAFDTNLKKLVTDRNAAAAGSAAYLNLVNQISNQLQIKDDCDKWMTNTKYSLGGTIALAVETSANIVTIPYVFEPSANYQSTVNEITTPYNSCDLGGNSKANCTNKPNTVSSWTEIARIDGRYTMSDRYVEKYTGDVVNVASDKTCDAKDIYFTSFYEVTRPVSTNPSDKGYSLKLTGTNIGNNIKLAGDKWNLTVDCWYTLKNLIFPQKTTGVTDEYYNLFGNTAFMYRQVDLTTPFPNRKPGENWEGKAGLITNNRTNIQDKTKYEIILNPETIRKIKEYNSHYKYDNYDFTTTGKSKFIEANPDIFKRK